LRIDNCTFEYVYQIVTISSLCFYQVPHKEVV